MPNHAERNRLALFASTTEAIRQYAHRGLIDLDGLPNVAKLLEHCHDEVKRMEEEAAASNNPEPSEVNDRG